MESDISQERGRSFDFGFGFNDVKFSDRTIRLLITTIDSSHNHKRRRVETSNGNKEAVESNGNTSSKDGLANWIKTIHISTIVLAAKSPFFYQLFSNGMAESNQQHVTIQIQESEEVSFMDLLKFMYTNTLSGSTPSALLDVLIAADKYEVESCMNYCFHLLKKLPITRESALLYLDFHPTILMANAAQSLKDAAKEFLVASSNEMCLFSEEMLDLPLVGIEAVLSSDDLQVGSEDMIYNFVMTWAQKHYKKVDERQEILTTRLLRLIRFPFMSSRCLEKFLTCTDINIEVSAKLVVPALSFQIPHRELPFVPVERAYRYRPVKIIRFISPHKECHAYLDLKHEECARLLPSDRIYSQSFDLAGQEFYLMGERCENDHTSDTFAFYLGKEESRSIGIEFEFSWRQKRKKEFVSQDKLHYNFAEDSEFGFHDLFEEPWDTVIAGNSPYFINGVLHLRVVIKLKKQEQHID